jgi:molybdate transport system substrate-binding protein
MADRKSRPIDFGSLRMKHASVGLDRSRPTHTRHVAQALLFARTPGLELVANVFNMSKLPAAVWSHPMLAKPFRQFSRHRRNAAARLILLTPATALAIVLLGATVSAAEIHVLSAAAMQSVFKEVAGEFERTSGHRLVISYGTIGGIAERVEANEAADLVIGSSLSMPGLVKSGKIAASSLVTICKTAIGIVVSTATPLPHVASVEDFKGALLAAKVVVYADPARGGAAGVHIGRMIDQLGLTERLRPKTKFAAGGDVTEITLSSGEGALGMTQVSEIVEKEGATFVGPLPDDLQNITAFVVGFPVDAKPLPAATAFVRFLQGPGAVRVIKAKGMQPG